MNRYKPLGWQHESHRHSLAAKGIRTSFVEYRIDLPGGWTRDERGKVMKKVKNIVDLHTDIISKNREIKIWPDFKHDGFVIKGIKEYQPGKFLGYVYRVGKENSWDYNKQYVADGSYEDLVKYFKFNIDNKTEFLEDFEKYEMEHEEWRKKNP